jgi:hypothetical protein
MYTLRPITGVPFHRRAVVEGKIRHVMTVLQLAQHEICADFAAAVDGM